MKKKIKPQTKENLKNVFGSLYSNQRAIDGARHNRWWVALIMFAISVLLPVIPVTVHAYNQYATSFFTNGLKSFDTQITDFSLDLKENDIDLVIADVNETHKLEDKGGKWKTKYEYYSESSTDIQYARINENSHQYDLLVYFVNPIETRSFNTIVSEILKNQYELKTTNKYVEPTSTEEGTEDSSSEEEIKLYKATTLIFSETTVALTIYLPDKTDVYGALMGDYEHTEIGTNFKNFAMIDGVIADNKNQSNIDAVKAKWFGFFDETYITFRNNAVLLNTFLSLGIYIVLGFFMGLMVFLLTRGKKNIFRVYTFGDCQKISAWSMVSPALLGMILGFFIQDYAMMFFIILLGVRVMWLSMKQLRPANR